MISELITVSHSHRHLNDITSLVLSRNATTEYTIQSSLSDTLAAVTITQLDSYRYVHEQINSITAIVHLERDNLIPTKIVKNLYIQVMHPC